MCRVSRNLDPSRPRRPVTGIFIKKYIYYHKICIGLRVKYPLFLSGFNENIIFSIDSWKSIKYKISRKYVQWEPICSTRPVRHTRRSRRFYENAQKRVGSSFPSLSPCYKLGTTTVTTAFPKEQQDHSGRPISASDPLQSPGIVQETPIIFFPLTYQ